MICGEVLEQEIVTIAAGRMSIYTCPECNGNDETGKDSHWAHISKYEFSNSLIGMQQIKNCWHRLVTLGGIRS